MGRNDKKIVRLFGCLVEPIRRNGGFFFFMYVLGVVCAWIEVPAYPLRELYSNTYIELFVDLYIICVVLLLLPVRIRRWFRALLYVLFYGMSVVDVFCFVRFFSMFSPSVLLLVVETNGREASEFLSSYVGFDLFFTPLVWILFIMLLHILKSVFYNRLRNILSRFRFRLSPALVRSVTGVLVFGLLVYGGIVTSHNKAAIHRLLSFERLGDVEHELTQQRTCAQLYTPLHRLVFSIRSNRLAANQLDQLHVAMEKVHVDSCSFDVPNIVLIIGESYNRHHSGLYGYDKSTTPRQEERLRTDHLVAFSDVVAPWNLTSYVIKLMFSPYTVGDDGEWCDYPLFPTIFRAAGYRVTFITNKLQVGKRDLVFNFSGGFFLNNSELSRSMFDVRNNGPHPYDDGLLADYDSIHAAGQLAENNLVIFHLMGQHSSYKARYPRDRRFFKENHYKDRTDLVRKDIRNLSDYDNATLYNDSIVDQIIQRFEEDLAVVIYVPDHGEECYDGILNKFGRLHMSEIDARLAREEFDIPFWVWCSRRFVASHPEIYEQLLQAKDRPYMTDALPHLLLYLGGIATPLYRERFNPLVESYDERRPRLLKMQTDYNTLNVRK